MKDNSGSENNLYIVVDYPFIIALNDDVLFNSSLE